MRQVARNGLITVAAASGMLAITGGYAHANGGALGITEDAAGILSGNVVQAPVNAPVNLCGNTINVLGALNPAIGNECTASSESGDSDGGNGSGSGVTAVSSNAEGVGSGNVIQLPIDAPVNLCGNNIGLGALENAAMDNECTSSISAHEEGDEGSPEGPGDRDESTPNRPEPDGTSNERVELAETGAPAGVLGVALPAGAALVLGGAVLYRRSRAGARS